MAHGLYIIGNGRTGMKDYIKEPETGLLLKNPKDKKKLAEMITAVKANKRTVQSQKLIECFDHENVDQIMRKIYFREFMEE